MVYAAGIAMSLPLKLFKPEKYGKCLILTISVLSKQSAKSAKREDITKGCVLSEYHRWLHCRGDKAHLAYSGSKAAMDASVRCIAKEVADKGICINTVAPAMTGNADVP